MTSGITSLEPHTAHEVDNPWAPTRACDSTKACRVKLSSTKCEVCIVQNVDERCLQFEADPLANRKSLCNAHVNVVEPPAIHAVHREVAKRTRRGLSQQSGFES